MPSTNRVRGIKISPKNPLHVKTGKKKFHGAKDEEIEGIYDLPKSAGCQKNSSLFAFCATVNVIVAPKNYGLLDFSQLNFFVLFF